MVMRNILPKIHIRTVRFLIGSVCVMLMSLNCFANKQLSIGQTETVYLNPSLPSGAWITSAGWSTDVVGLNYFDAGTWGTGIVADGYWSDTATLKCFYSYSYYGKDGNIHVGSGNEYWYFTCKGFPVTLTPTSVNLDKGDKATLKFSITGAKIGKIPPVWESDDKSVATVYSTGDYTAEVHAKAPGTCLITCYSFMGEPVYCNVTVNSFPPTQISLTPSEADVTEGKSITLKYNLYPEGASAKLTWSSDNPSVATVQHGKVTGVSIGKARIKVTTDNGLSAYSDIAVVEKFSNPRGPVSTALKGNGTEKSPYLIESASDLRFLADKVNAGSSYRGEYFKQTKDIVINSSRYNSSEFKNQEVWIPIGKYDFPFEGNYDGDGHEISGVYLANRDELYKEFKGIGVFGTINSGTSISNLNISNIFVDMGTDESDNFADAYFIGSLVGFSYLRNSNIEIVNCHVSKGSIEGEDVGGIVGYIYGKNRRIITL